LIEGVADQAYPFEHKSMLFAAPLARLEITGRTNGGIRADG
jgi:hypothetical protein